MKNLLIIVLFLGPWISKAQHLEVGVNLGVTFYEGDLTITTVKDRLGEINPGGGGFLRYNINDFLAARFSINYGKVTGEDGGDRAERNLSFSSNILEFALTGEINILGYQPYNLTRVFSPYVFGGIALFKFNPQSELDGITYDLQPLGTEGQGLAEFPDRQFYNLTQFSIPVGLGLKYALSDALNIGIEGGIRVTFTDYLDDVSLTYPGSSVLLENRGDISAALSDRSINGLNPGPGAVRGNPSVNDYYLFGGLTISYNFMDNGLVGFRGRRGSKTGCPTF